MRPLAEEIFLQEIARQILGARRAINRLRKSINDRNGEVAYDEAVYFLNHAAVVSKILIPLRSAGSQAILRGQYLRKILGIDESEPALDRKLRNHLEHIDERLDEWVLQNKSGIFIDGGLFPFLPDLLFENAKSIRHIDPKSCFYTFLGEGFNINAIDASLERIWNAAVARGKVLKVPGGGRDFLREQSKLPPDDVE
ncbi:MAG: hypothetical protein ACREE1_08455 [Stellaceae bacterium]